MVNEDRENAAPTDAELLGREMDKMEEKQRGKDIVIDQQSVKLEVESLLEKARQSGTAAGRQAAIEGILLVEKRGRLAEDPFSTKMACCSVITLLYQAGDLKELQEKLVLMTKRRGQLKEAVKGMVRQCMEYVEDEGVARSMTRTQKEEMIRILQSITEGKIYVEIERARITRQLARMKEEDGEVSEAANILQEVAVVRYILLRIKLKKKNFRQIFGMLWMQVTIILFSISYSYAGNFWLYVKGRKNSLYIGASASVSGEKRLRKSSNIISKSIAKSICTEGQREEG